MCRGLTAKGAATKHKIVDATVRLVRDKGPSETNLGDVLPATATSRSQLLHYFPEGRTASSWRSRNMRRLR